MRLSVFASTTTPSEAIVLCDEIHVQQMYMGTIANQGVREPYAGLGCHFEPYHTVLVERIMRHMSSRGVPPSVYIHGSATISVDIVFRLRLSGRNEAIEIFGVDPAAGLAIPIHTYLVICVAESEFVRSRVVSFFNAYRNTGHIDVLLQSPLGSPRRTIAHSIVSGYSEDAPQLFSYDQN